MQEKPYFCHQLSDVQAENIGAGTRIWQFVVVLAGAKIGRNCNINAHCFVENDVVVGDNVTVKCGNYLWDGVRLEDNVFVGPNATFTNDKLPRSQVYPTSFPTTLVKRGASIGAGAVILPGITIGAGAMVAAGAVVTRDVPDDALVVGSPARVVRFLTQADRDTPAG
jgi:UDP-2-acetamido-3-amino-2,3-dideoxy-glucuronate N-acetyltransferase